jgi:MraZ protein
MFLGTYTHIIDAKGRLFIPARLRGDSESKGRFILTKGLENCLYLYEANTFQNVLVKLGTLPVKNQQDGRAFKRLLLAGAQEVELDDMGRVLIARPLIEYAELKKEVAILGVGERIELWSEKKWTSYSEKSSGTFQKLGKELEI